MVPLVRAVHVVAFGDVMMVPDEPVATTVTGAVVAAAAASTVVMEGASQVAAPRPPATPRNRRRECRFCTGGRVAGDPSIEVVQPRPMRGGAHG